MSVDTAARDLAGRPLLVAFFDLRQRPSRHYLKKLAAKADALQAKGLTLVIVQAAPIEAEQLHALAAKLELPFALSVIAADPEKTRAAWGVKGLPGFILTDADHIVRAEDFGLNELDAKLAEIAGR